MRIAVLTSGGDAPGMNAAIRAVVRTGGPAAVGVPPRLTLSGEASGAGTCGVHVALERSPRGHSHRRLPRRARAWLPGLVRTEGGA
jgi:hypothetical protein